MVLKRGGILFHILKIILMTVFQKRNGSIPKYPIQKIKLLLLLGIEKYGIQSMLNI